MRAVWVAAAVLLAGCAASEPATPADLPVEAPALAEPLDILATTVSWHWDEGTSPIAVFRAVYDPATQPAMHPCLFDGEPYFNNLPLSEKGHMGHVPAGTRSVEVALDWEDADFLGDRLALAYRAGPEAPWRESEYVERGGSIVLPVPNQTQVPAGSNVTEAGNTTEPPGHAGDSYVLEAPQMWDVWVCLSRTDDAYPGSTGFSPEPFHGDVTARVTAHPTPPAPQEM